MGCGVLCNRFVVAYR